jgi:hypothetical protein
VAGAKQDVRTPSPNTPNHAAPGIVDAVLSAAVMTLRRRSIVVAGVLAVVPYAAAHAATAPPGDDPELAALLLTAADLPPGWSPFTVGTPPTADPGTNLDDPCVALLHRFDSAYEEPHAVAGFLSGSLGALAEVIFRLDSAAAATELAEAHLADIAGCPNLTGADGRVTTFVPLDFPEFGDTSGASQGDWSMGGVQLLHSVVAVGDLVITVDISGTGADPSLLEELTATAVERADPGALPADEPGGVPADGAPPAGKTDVTLPLG